MLDEKDFKKIGKLLDEKVANLEKMIENSLDDKLEEQQRNLRDDFHHELKMQELRLRENLRLELKHIKLDLTKANRNIDKVIDFFDKEVLDLSQRVDRIEEILNLRTLNKSG